MQAPTPNSAETDRLLQRAQAGDRRAFEELFARYRPYLEQVIALRLDARLRRRLDPSDGVQEAQIDAFRRLPDFLRRQPMPFRLWLRKTAPERLLKLREQHIDAARRSVEREERLPDHSSRLLVHRFMAPGSTRPRHTCTISTSCPSMQWAVNAACITTPCNTSKARRLRRPSRSYADWLDGMRTAAGSGDPRRAGH